MSFRVIPRSESEAIRAAALEYQRRGWSIFPCCRPRADGEGCYQHGACETPGKHPLVRWKIRQEVLPTEQEVTNWWSQWHDANIGVATGAVSGIVVIDADTDEAVADLLARGGLENAPRSITGKGCHFYVRHPGFKVGNKVRILPGVDIRGDGGYAVMPPSQHKSGRSYHWAETGGDWDPAAVPEMPQWIVDLLKGPTRHTPLQDGVQENDVLGIADNSLGSLDLRDYVEGIREGERDTKLFALAGRLRRENASIDSARMTLLMAARLCTPPFDEDKAEEIIGRVWRTYPPACIDEGDGVTAFPTDALPEAVRRYVAEAAASLVVPPDFVAVPLLAAAGAVIGKRLELALKPDWHEGPNMYALYVGEPGSKKTPAANKGLDPHRRLQRRLHRVHSQQMDDWREEHAAWERDRRSKTAGREPKEPPFPHLLTTDPTVEALVPILKESHGVAITIDEAVALVRAMNQYKAGGKGADRQHFLSFWGRVDVKVDRKGNHNEPIMVSRPCLSIVGGIQPDLIASLADHSGDDGFLDRILWSWPEPMDDVWSEEEISQDAKDEMDSLFELLYALDYDSDRLDGPAPVVVRLAPEAKERLIRWHNQNATETKCVARDLRGAWSKMPSQLGRIALVVHAIETVRGLDPHATLDEVIDGECKTTVAAELSLETLEGAIALVDYFKAHARRVHGALHRSGRPSRGGGRAPVDVIRRKIIDALRGTKRMKHSDMLHDVFWRNHAKEVKEALEALEREGVIASEIEHPPGCPPTKYWRLVADQEIDAA